MAAFSSRDRFSDHLKQVDRQPRKGRSKLNRNFGGGAPFYQDTPSKADLQRGLSELGFKMSPQQFEKLRNMHGAEVLKSIVTIGRRSGDGPTSASDNSSSSSRNGGQKVKVELNHTGQTDKRNRESVDALLQMPAPEAKRIVASGDYSEDTDRVVTGLESDRHRHFEYKELGRKKAELHALQCLKACGPDPATVFKKIQKHNTSGGGGGGGGGDTKTNDALSKKEIRQGLAELAGVQLSSADLDSVIRKFDPKTGGKDGITLRQFSQVLSKIPNVHKAKTGRQARQHHIDVINLTNKKSLDPNKLAAAVNQRAIAFIDSKVSKRFGTEPERLRRLFKAMESNGDGTISANSLKKGFDQLGMGISNNEFTELIKKVRDVQSKINVSNSSDDIYFSDIVHAFEHEVVANSVNEASLRFSNDIPRPSKKKVVSKTDYTHDEHTGLPSHHVHVDDHHNIRVNAFDEVPTGNKKAKFRPKAHTAEYRHAIKVKKQLLAKLSEKGRSVADCFIALDSDRDGLITPRDMRKGLMMNLGVQLSKNDLKCLVDHVVERSNGVTYQEFAHALQCDDKYHAYANDKDGSGGGGLLEGPVAAAVGVDAVKRWTGRKEHRGQLSSALTATGTLSIGSQYADPHGVGVIGGTLTAREHASNIAKSTQMSAKERLANKIATQVGTHIRQRDKLLSETFIDMDLNQHGSLSYGELRSGLDRVGVHLNNDDFALLVSQLDKDNNGRVEFVEFARCVKADVRTKLEPERMIGPTLDKNGHPIRVGMSLTTTEKNNSQRVNEVLQMPPAANIIPLSSRENIGDHWVAKQYDVISEGSPAKRTKQAKGPADDSIEDLSHVATRLKVRDTLTTKIGHSMREQYLSLKRDANSGGVTVSSLHQTLLDHGADVTKSQVADLLVTAGLSDTLDNSMKKEIKFNDYKNLIHLTGLGDDLRSYDFARSVQLPPGVGLQAGGLKSPDRSTATIKSALEKHVPKHLSQAAGGAASKPLPSYEFDKPSHDVRKYVTKYTNAESGAITGMVEPNYLSVAHDDSDDVLHDLSQSSTYLSSKHTGKHFNMKYRQHDHIDEFGLMNGGKIHASLGHSGAVGAEQHSHHGDHDHGGRRHVVHGNKGDLGDHISEKHLLERRASVRNVRSGSTRNLTSEENAVVGRSAGKLSNNKLTRKVGYTPRHLQSDNWFRHDTHLKKNTFSTTNTSASGSRQTAINASPSSASTPKASRTKVLRMTVRPPSSPAARIAAEEKLSRIAYEGAAGVSAAAAANRSVIGRSGRKHVRREDNNLFKNMQYPNGN